MATYFGRTSGSSTYSASANQKTLSRFTVGASDVTFRRAGIRVSSGGSGTGATRFVIYDDTGSGGAPGALVARSDEVIGVSAGGTIDFWFPSDVTLLAGANYYLGVHPSNGFTAFAQSVAAATYYGSDTYSDGSADPAGTMTLNTTRELAAFALVSLDEVLVAKATAVAVLGPPGLSVAKAYGLAVLSTEARVSVAKAHVLAVLDAATAAEVSRPQLMVAT